MQSLQRVAASVLHISGGFLDAGAYRRIIKRFSERRDTLGRFDHAYAHPNVVLLMLPAVSMAQNIAIGEYPLPLPNGLGRALFDCGRLRRCPLVRSGFQ